MSKDGKVERDDEEIDFSGLVELNDDDMLESGMGFNFGGDAVEVESLEDINKDIEDIKKAQDKGDDEGLENDNPEDDNKDEKDEKRSKSAAAEKTGKAKADDKEESKEEKVDDGSGEESPLKVFADFLKEKGIIDFDSEKFEDTEEFLIDRITDQIKSGIEEYKSSFSPRAKELIDAIEAGVPAEELLNKNYAIETYESLSDDEIDENEALQKSLVRNLYSAQGYSPEAVEKKIKRLDDAGLLADEAKDAKAELIEISKAEKEEMKRTRLEEEKNRTQRFEDWKNNIKTTLKEKDELIPGLKMTETQKKAVQEGLTVFDREGKNELQRTMEKDPLFNMKVAYLALALKWDLSALDKKAQTNAAKGLRESIKNMDKMRGGSDNTPIATTGGKVNFDLIRKTMKQ